MVVETNGDNGDNGNDEVEVEVDEEKVAAAQVKIEKNLAETAGEKNSEDEEESEESEESSEKENSKEDADS